METIGGVWDLQPKSLGKFQTPGPQGQGQGIARIALTLASKFRILGV